MNCNLMCCCCCYCCLLLYSEDVVGESVVVIKKLLQLHVSGVCVCNVYLIISIWLFSTCIYVFYFVCACIISVVLFFVFIVFIFLQPKENKDLIVQVAKLADSVTVSLTRLLVCVCAGM